MLLLSPPGNCQDNSSCRLSFQVFRNQGRNIGRVTRAIAQGANSSCRLSFQVFRNQGRNIGRVNRAIAQGANL